MAHLQQNSSQISIGMLFSDTDVSSGKRFGHGGSCHLANEQNEAFPGQTLCHWTQSWKEAVSTVDRSFVCRRRAIGALGTGPCMQRCEADVTNKAALLGFLLL